MDAWRNLTRLEDWRSATDNGRLMDADAENEPGMPETLGTPPVSDVVLDKLVKRDARGRIVKGSRALNPAGKPKGPTLTGVLRKLADRGQNKEQLAQVLWNLAMSGDINALRLVFDRLDGKVIDRRQVESVGHQRIQLDWSRTPELQQPIDITPAGND